MVPYGQSQIFPLKISFNWKYVYFFWHLSRHNYCHHKVSLCYILEFYLRHLPISRKLWFVFIQQKIHLGRNKVWDTGLCTLNKSRQINDRIWNNAWNNTSLKSLYLLLACFLFTIQPSILFPYNEKYIWGPKIKHYTYFYLLFITFSHCNNLLAGQVKYSIQILRGASLLVLQYIEWW